MSGSLLTSQVRAATPSAWLAFCSSSANRRQAIYASRERHSSSRWNNQGYPQRCLRTADYLYIWNVHPERWPAGDPQDIDKNGKLGPMNGAYNDIGDFDQSVILLHRDDPKINLYFHLAVDKRPAVELYAIRDDPCCLKKLAEQPSFRKVRRKLAVELTDYLKKTGDLRMGPSGEESY